jgi:hypothetical protein
MTLGLIVRCALAGDINRIAHRGGWNIDVHPVTAHLDNHPERIAPAAADSLTSARLRYDAVVTCGGSGTYPAIDPALSGTGVFRLQGDTCYDVVARDEVLDALAEESGTYFLTEFLARTPEHTVVRELGLDDYLELRHEYFRHCRRVLWLAKLPTRVTRRAAERAASRIGLPLVVRELGDSGLEWAIEDLATEQASHPTTPRVAGWSSQ